MAELSHVDESGAARMVDVGGKPDTVRVATASGRVAMRPETAQLIRDNGIAKGDVLAVARLAGIMAAKRTSELIPLCHNIVLSSVEVTLKVGEDSVAIAATARAVGQTGVEMEALTAVSVAALAIYDMAKAVDRGMRIEDVQLEAKSGGVHGDWRREKG